MNKITNTSTSFSRAARSLEILSLIIRGVLKYLRQRLNVGVGKDDGDTSSHRREYARWLRAEFVKLGPTFVKLGQIMSTRADLFHQEVIEELACLQDNVPPAPFEEIQTVVEQELGADLDELFVAFDRTALASASIAQVHLAQVLNGEELLDVVVKVQRPGVRELVEEDLSVFELFAKHLFFLPRISQSSDVQGTLRELRETFARELNYSIEAQNIERLRDILCQDFQTFRVVVPGLVLKLNGRKFCSSSVLTLRYVPGTKISEFRGSVEDVKAVLTILVIAFLVQYVKAGFFHADPHPGNIAVSRDDQGVYVIFYDLGMVGELKQSVTEALLRMAFAALRGDAQGVVAECVATGILPHAALRDPEVIREVGRFLNELSLNLSFKRVGEFRKDLFETSELGVISVPKDFTALSRSVFSLQGVIKNLKVSWPELDESEFLVPKVLPFLVSMYGEQVNPLERSVSDTKRLLRLFSTLVARSTKLIEELEEGKIVVPVKDTDSSRGVRRLKYGVKSTNSALLFLAFFLSGSGLLVNRDVLPGLGLVLVSIFFLERWFFSERRMEK